ncbi:MAG: xanthine dehydrogenase family protein molybdopterin-binding subunit [Geminicoccaceae bacterium]|nr:MAG: xanthine dehydrogenase family protein molybdopterin-binding subunit [Geminicoccaceae bacterium]
MSEIDQGLLSAGKFGVGQSVPRNEDPKLVQGRGCYTDDLALPGELHACMVRSTVAAGTIQGFDVTAAREAPGVVAVYTAFDLVEAGYGGVACRLPLQHHDGTAMHAEPRPAFASAEIRHIGEPMAVVVATSPALAKDAADLVEVDIETKPAVVDPLQALEPDAPQVSPDYPNNLCLDYAFGDEAAVEAAFAQAAHVTRLRLVQNRLACAPMEPRAAVAEFDGERGRYTLHVGCQGVFGLKTYLVRDVLKCMPEQLRVITYDVGGSFGMKIAPYPEYTAILHAAKMLGRPVRWRDERSESFLSDHQAREGVFDCALALDADGNFLAVDVRVVANMGGYVSFVGPMMPSLNIRKNVPGPYRTPLLHVRSKSVLTHTVPIGPYRGAGRPEGVYVMERLIEQAASETGRDPLDLRRRNLITPDALPFKAASDLVYDSGDFPRLFDRALERADAAGYAQRKAQSAARGKLRGRAVACYLEVTADAVEEMGALRFEADGRVTMITGTSDYGQGHWSTFAQIMVDRLGLPFDKLDLVQKDSDALTAGGGSGGSRSVMNSSMALLAAADEVETKARKWAAHALEAPEIDLVFQDGDFSVVGTDRRVSLLEVAKLARESGPIAGLPEDIDASLNVKGAPSAFPNGVHYCELEVDEATGVVTIDRYVSVNDFGTIVNPMLTRGQIQGGVVQGIGQALFENVVFDGEGQLLTGSFMDYCMPRADAVPPIQVEFVEVPAKTNPLGAKGCGEAGATGAPPTVMNALLDALRPLGVDHLDMPATSEVVWAAMQGARIAAE